ncbi:transposase [Aeromonas jandaei]|uniref:transposase n=1 Tax=Aeromonas jandaei TaxID=650 RepID=UPI003BA1D6E4
MVLSGEHRRNWGKLHIGQSPEGDILVAALTDSGVSDPAMLDQFLDAGIPLNKVIADGAYYDLDRNTALLAQGITPVIPPKVNAKVNNKPGTEHHDQLVQYIEEKEIYAFHKKYGYGVRAKVEAQFSRLKRCLGENLKLRRDSSRRNEGIVIVNILNLWNSFVRAQYFQIA